MYVIVVGAGQIGTQLIDIATQSKHEVVVVERDAERAEATADRFDCLVLNDDATEKETLQDAGAGKADAIISTTDDDAVNIMVMLLAEDLEIPSRVSVVHNPDHMALFRRLGVNTIENPQRLIAQYLFRAVQRPSIQDFMDLAGDAEIFEITVAHNAPIAGKTLTEAAAENLLADDVLVVAIEREGETLAPRGSTGIEAGDVVTVFAKQGFDEAIERAFTGEVASSS